MTAEARKFLRDELARAFPRARVGFLPPSDSGRHVVARIADGKRILYAKAAVDPSMTIDAEADALHAAKKLAVPKIIARKPRWFAVDALKGRPKRTWSHDDVKRVAQLLAQLHAQRAPKNLRPLPGGARIESAVGEGQRAVVLLREERVLSKRDAASIEKELTRRKERALLIAELDEPAQVLCHGDARGPNVYFDGDAPQLLDFEHAGRGDPAIDLARTAIYERLSPHAFFVLCDAYAEVVKDDAAVDRAIAVQPALAIVLALSAARHLAATKTKTKTSDGANALAERLSHLIERPVALELRST